MYLFVGIRSRYTPFKYHFTQVSLKSVSMKSNDAGFNESFIPITRMFMDWGRNSYVISLIRGVIGNRGRYEI